MYSFIARKCVHGWYVKVTGAHFPVGMGWSNVQELVPSEANLAIFIILEITDNQNPNVLTFSDGVPLAFRMAKWMAPKDNNVVRVSMEISM